MLREMINSWKSSMDRYRPALRRANEFYVKSENFDLFIRAAFAATLVMSAWRNHKTIQAQNRH
uniref:Uncharacterized protein n=1 Tax=Daucus carota subsp. sativus TaxID=79200 RepID=A0A164UPW6_DAUCS